jgi:predicted O-methyltransferase YrrM
MVNSDKLNTIFQYLKYVFLAKHRNGHGVHSPYIYDFVTNVLFSKNHFEEYERINQCLSKLRKSKQIVVVDEMGGGSKAFCNAEREISGLVKISSVNKKYGRLLFRIAHYYQPSSILEIGTSIGVSSMYLSCGSPKSMLYTVEGNQTLIDVAKENLKALGNQNVNFNCGLFDDILEEILPKIEKPELVFIDGNHTYEATIRYYQLIRPFVSRGMIILDDIYWSKEMQKAWQEICLKETVSIDLFQFGIIILEEQLTPGQYRIRF